MYLIFFVKKKTAYEMRISDWSSDVCSSDLIKRLDLRRLLVGRRRGILLLFAMQQNQHVAVLDVGDGRVGGELERGLDVRFGFGGLGAVGQIGRASCRERVCQYVSIRVVAVSFNKHKHMP